jgi:nicotinate-nucleotide adenylyltransferase
MKKIGILGGTFDPIHNGHIHLANIVLQKTNLNEIWFMPNNIPPHKQSMISSSKNRLEMISLAIKNNKSFVACDIELKREGTSFTIETLKELHLAYPKHEFRLICGSDILETINLWKEPQKVIELGKPIIISRVNQNREKIINKIDKSLGESCINILINGFLEVEEVNTVSSTFIRKSILLNKDISKFVPEDVEKYIKINKLYKN